MVRSILIGNKKWLLLSILKIWLNIVEILLNTFQKKKKKILMSFRLKLIKLTTFLIFFNFNLKLYLNSNINLSWIEPFLNWIWYLKLETYFIEIYIFTIQFYRTF